MTECIGVRSWLLSVGTDIMTTEAVAIQVSESNFASAGSRIIFDGTKFKFRSSLTDGPKDLAANKIHIDDIEYVNRPQIRKIGATDTNVFKSAHLSEMKVIGEIIQVFSIFTGMFTPKEEKLYVRFKDGRYFRGKSDLDTIFKLNRILLQNKKNRDVSNAD